MVGTRRKKEILRKQRQRSSKDRTNISKTIKVNKTLRLAPIERKGRKGVKREGCAA
jgi:hypothetical protein